VVTAHFNTKYTQTYKPRICHCKFSSWSTWYHPLQCQLFMDNSMWQLHLWHLV